MSLVRSGAQTLDSLYELFSQAELVEVMPAVILPLLDQAAILTADWYENLAPGTTFRVSDDQLAVSEGRVNYTAVWTFRQSGMETPAARMTGAFQRMAFDASRAVVVANAKREGVAWHRDAQADACSFCRLLTVDPHAYSGKYVDMPSHNHDCRCIAVVSRPGNPYVTPEYIASWRNEVTRSKSASLTSTLAHMESSNV